MDRNENETDSEKLERQLEALADLRLEQEAGEDILKSVVEAAARKGTTDNWPDMPDEERQRLVEEIVSNQSVTYQLSIFKRGWSTGQGAERIRLDPDVAGPRILVRAYATAEVEALRMRRTAEGRDPERPSLENRLRRYLPGLG